jgi:predicted transglutaminase-like cysteine proteinase
MFCLMTKQNGHGFRRSLRSTLVALAVAGALFGGAAAKANLAPTLRVDERQASLTVDRQAPTPSAWIDFCRRFAEACRPSALPGAALALTEPVLALIHAVNAEVNAAVAPATDRDLYGTAEHWTLPVAGRGDCEDVALLKRERLMALGIPSSVLLMTIVRDGQGQGHAVLTLVTDRGDLVLDNQTDAVSPWYETGYRFLMRQSRMDPNRWQALGSAREAVTARHIVRLTPEIVARAPQPAAAEEVALLTVDGRAS